MSVINKMLRDLDSRQAPDFARGTALVKTAARGPASGGLRARAGQVAAVAFLLGLGGGAWFYLGGAKQDVASLAPQGNSVAREVPVEAAAPFKPDTISRSLAEPDASQRATANSAIALKMDTEARLAPHLFESPPPGTKSNAPANVATPPVLAAAPAVTAVDAVQARKPATLAASAVAAPVVPASVQPASVQPAAVVSPVPSSTVAAATVAVPSSLAVQRQAAASEALAQAQGLWNAGTRDAAVELMREAVDVAERGAPSGGSGVLVPLVRELARMELAQGQAARALELLTRLEPVIAGQADLWAVRGNAAQRLGRHQESANAYLQALRLRPEEPRWMLGAAVSLAAQGQITAAGDLADRARAGGALSRDVANYLRQLGVPLREQ